MIVILIGVAGAGKTTVGGFLAWELGWPFHEGDDLHPPGNISKMARGIPLTDADRAPWIEAICRLLRRLADEGRSAVVACSALRRAHRERLRACGEDVRIVFLKAPREILKARLTVRRGHWFGPELLDSQFEALEEPEDALVVDANKAPEEIVRRVRRELGL